MLTTFILIFTISVNIANAECSLSKLKFILDQKRVKIVQISHKYFEGPKSLHPGPFTTDSVSQGTEKLVPIRLIGIRISDASEVQFITKRIYIF